MAVPTCFTRLKSADLCPTASAGKEKAKHADGCVLKLTHICMQSGSGSDPELELATRTSALAVDVGVLREQFDGRVRVNRIAAVAGQASTRVVCKK